MKLLLAVGILTVALVFLFGRLGHNALWDDEAGTALSALGVWRTGDTTAILDHNLVAYESGKDLRNLHERLMPPLPAYLTAPFIGLFGQNALAARLPFALCGAACVGLMLWWLWRTDATASAMFFFAAALLTNVSFFLFCRQCRYYAPAMLASVVVAWVYVHHTGRRWQTVLFTLASVALFASNYLNWAALYFCLALDYAVWGRKKIRLSPADWIILITPQIVLGGFILSIWNPFAILGATERFPEAGKLLHLWWCVRDVVTCEFGGPVFIFLGLLFYFTRKETNPWLLRACVCLLVYIFVLSLLVQRPPSLRGVASVRYFTPVIPLFIAISVMSLTALHRRAKWAAVALALAAFSTNLLNGGPLLAKGWQSTIARFARELVQPPGDPYTVTAKWIQENVRPKESVWALPDFAAYPLMFHAPQPIYAWQLTWPPARKEFEQLAPILFIGREPPQYIIGFGPATELAKESLASWNRPEIQYRQVATIDFYWKEMHRPELFWRTFVPITNYDRNTEAIYVFKLQPIQNQNPSGL